MRKERGRPAPATKEKAGPADAKGTVARLYPWVKPVLRKGIPKDAIVQAANREDVDLIVMGTHGRRGAARLLAGSVAARVVATASCPVLTVRGDAKVVPMRGSPSA